MLGTGRRLAVDRNDLDFGEVLAMALTLLVVLTTAHLEDTDLVVTTMRNHFHQHRCTFDQRSTKLDAVARANGEDLIDREFGTNVSRYLFYFKFFTSDNFVLLATGFYDRVHDLKPHQMLKESLAQMSRTAALNCLKAGEQGIIHGTGMRVKADCALRRRLLQRRRKDGARPAAP
jgi:hypothetical protein